MKRTKQKTQMKRDKDTSQIEKLQDSIRVRKIVKPVITDISAHETIMQGKHVSIQDGTDVILSLGVREWDRINPGKLNKELRDLFGLS